MVIKISICIINSSIVPQALFNCVITVSPALPSVGRCRMYSYCPVASCFLCLFLFFGNVTTVRFMLFVFVFVVLAMLLPYGNSYAFASSLDNSALLPAACLVLVRFALLIFRTRPKVQLFSSQSNPIKFNPNK